MTAHPRGARDTLPVSGYVICQNEEALIARCLESLSFCREIVVVDSGSSDRTLDIVRGLADAGLPIRLLVQPWLGYARQKQFALDQTTSPWCLNLDADEALDPDLAGHLPVLLDAPESVAGWRLRHTTSQRHGLALAVRAKPILRLVRRGRARYDARGLVHERLMLDGAARDAKVGLIRHERHLSLHDQLEKELRYARLRATERVQQGRRPSLPKLVFNPPYRFLRAYLLQRWFLEGRNGFVHACTAAFYAFCAEAMHFDLVRPGKGETPLG